MRRLLSWILALSMTLSLVPTPAWAEVVEEAEAAAQEALVALEEDAVEEEAPDAGADDIAAPSDEDSATPADEGAPSTEAAPTDEVATAPEAEAQPEPAPEATATPGPLAEPDPAAEPDPTASEPQRSAADEGEPLLWLVDAETGERTTTLHTSRQYYLADAEGPVEADYLDMWVTDSANERLNSSVRIQTDDTDHSLLNGLYFTSYNSLYATEDAALPTGSYGITAHGTKYGAYVYGENEDPYLKLSYRVICDGLFHDWTGGKTVGDDLPAFSVHTYRQGYTDDRYDGMAVKGIDPTPQLSPVDVAGALRLRLAYASETELRGTNPVLLESLALWKSDRTAAELQDLDNADGPTRLTFKDTSRLTMLWERGDANLHERYVDDPYEPDTSGCVVIDQSSFPHIALADGMYYPLACFTIAGETYVCVYDPIEVASAETHRDDPRIATAQLPDATVGSPYSTRLTGRAGASPAGELTWATDGALPEGLTLDPAAGTISGTPTAAGEQTITVTLTETAGGEARSASRRLTLTVHEAVTLGDISYSSSVWPVVSNYTNEDPTYRLTISVPVSVDLATAGFSQSRPTALVRYTLKGGATAQEEYPKGMRMEPNALTCTWDIPQNVDKVTSIEVGLDLYDDNGNGIPSTTVTDNGDGTATTTTSDHTYLTKSVTNPAITFGGYAEFPELSFEGLEPGQDAPTENARLRLWPYDGSTSSAIPTGSVRTRYLTPYQGACLALEPGDYAFVVEGEVDVRQDERVVGSSWIDIVGASDNATALGGSLPKRYLLHVEPGETTTVGLTFTADNMDYFTVRPEFQTEDGDFVADLASYDVAWYRRPNGASDATQDVLVATGNTVSLEKAEAGERLFVQVTPRGADAVTWQRSARVEATNTVMVIPITRTPVYDVTLALSTENPSWEGAGIVEVRKPLMIDDEGSPVSYLSSNVWVFGGTAQLEGIPAGSVLTYTPRFESLCGPVSTTVVAGTTSYTLQAPYAKGIVTFEGLSFIEADDASRSSDDDVAARTASFTLTDSYSTDVAVYRHGTSERVDFYAATGESAGQARLLVRDAAAAEGASYDVVVRRKDPAFRYSSFSCDNYAAERTFEVTLSGTQAAATVSASDATFASRGRVQVPLTNPANTSFDLHLFDAAGQWVATADSFDYERADLPFLDAGDYTLLAVEKGLLSGKQGAYATLAAMQDAVAAAKPAETDASAVSLVVPVTVTEGVLTTTDTVRLPDGLGLATPIDRSNSSVSAATNYSDKLTIKVRTQLREGSALRFSGSDHIELVTNQRTGQSGEGYMNPRALVVNGSAVKLSRWKNDPTAANPFNNTQNMYAGDICLYLQRLDVADASGFPLDLQLVIPRTDTTAVDVTAWLVVNGRRYLIGSFYEKSQEITLTTPPKAAWKNFTVYGNTAPGAYVTTYLDGMRASTTVADEYGFYTANLSLPDDANDGDLFEVSAAATWDSDDTTVTVTSPVKQVSYSSTAPAVERLTVCYQREAGGEYHSFVAWDRGDLKSKYLSFYRAENENYGDPDADHAKYFWIIELANADKAENVVMNVPRSEGVQRIETTNSLETARTWIADVNTVYQTLLKDLQPLTTGPWRAAMGNLIPEAIINTTILWGAAGREAFTALSKGNAYVTKPTYFSYAPTGAYVTFDTPFEPYPMAALEKETTPFRGFKDDNIDQTELDMLAYGMTRNDNLYLRTVSEPRVDSETGKLVVDNLGYKDLGDAYRATDEGCLDEWIALGTGDDEKNEAGGWLALHHTVTTTNASSAEATADIAEHAEMHRSYRSATKVADLPTFDTGTVISSCVASEVGYDSWVYYYASEDAADDTTTHMMCKYNIAGTGQYLYAKIVADKRSYTRTEWDEHTGQKRVIRYELHESQVDDGPWGVGDVDLQWAAVLDTLQRGVAEALELMSLRYERTEPAPLKSPAVETVGDLTGVPTTPGQAKGQLVDKIKNWSWETMMYNGEYLNDRESGLLKKFLDKNKNGALHEEIAAQGTADNGTVTKNLWSACETGWAGSMTKKLGEALVDGSISVLTGGMSGGAKFLGNAAKDHFFGTLFPDPYSDLLKERVYQLYKVDRDDAHRMERLGFNKTDWSDIPPEIMKYCEDRYEREKAEAEQGAVDVNGVHDPSGLVYEAVLSNPVAGATVTLYTYNMAAHRAQFLDSTKFGVEENPQVTGRDGRYQWFVPEGFWQVRVTKQGYEAVSTGSSETYGLDATRDLDGDGVDDVDDWWMPVLPIQLDVNIGLVDATPPKVDRLEADEEGATVTFTKYVQVSAVTPDLFAVNGVAPASVEPLDADVAADGSVDESGAPLMLARSFRLTYPAETSLAAGENSVALSFNDAAGAVQSYAGTRIAEEDRSYAAQVVVDVKTPEDPGPTDPTPQPSKKANPLAASAVKAKHPLTYKPSAAQTLAAAKVFKVTGAQGAVSYAKKSGNAGIAVAKNGTVTVSKGLAAGSYKVVVTVKAAGNASYKAGSRDVAFTIAVSKAQPTVKALKKTVKVKKAKVKKKKQVLKSNIALTCDGKVTYKNVSKSKKAKKFKINKKTGKVTIPKGTKKGTYKLKIKVTVKAGKNYGATTKTISYKVKVK